MMKKARIFIVEDDDWYGDFLKYHISMNPDYSVEKITSGKDLLSKLHEKPSLITLDYGIPDIPGDKLLKKVKEINPEIPVIAISGQQDINTAVEMLKNGAFDYIVKDDNTKDRLWISIQHALENQGLREEVQVLRQEVKKKYEFDNLIKGNSASLQQVFKLIEKASKTNINVSITGETGTGKEVVAKSVHFNSERKSKSFVAVNIAAIPNELIESELFGHEKGAFTGAAATRTGKFEEANGGTIFLDEIGEMDINLQAKLLRVLQEREVVKVGSNKPIKLDVRVIVATHKNLAEEVREGNFREDLYYRLLGFPIELPPLRERDNDVIVLADFFIECFSKENKTAQKVLSKAAKRKLKDYHFPGNVRELKSLIELACVMSDGHEIQEEDIVINELNNSENMFRKEMTLKEYTEEIIFHFLSKYNNDVLLVADKLDVGKSTIYRLLKKTKAKEIEKETI